MRTTLITILALSFAVSPAFGEVLYSLYEGGEQFWITVDEFANRSTDGGSPNFVADPETVDPLSGSAYYFPRAEISQPADQLDWWVQYNIDVSILPTEFNLTGTWYFWTRVQQPPTDDSVQYNADADWLFVNGHPDDLNVSNPTASDWAAALIARTNEDDRIVQDIHDAGASRPGWVWTGDTASVRRPKTLAVYNDQLSFRIYEREAGPWNGRIDVICWSNTESFVPTDEGFAGAIAPGDCPTQHNTTSVNPPSHDNESDTVLTITGTNLEAVTGARLTPVAGGADIVATTIQVGPGPGETTLTATFPTTGATLGMYNVVTDQAPPCFSRQLSGAFEITCASSSAITGVTPEMVSDPAGTVQLTLSGQEVSLLSSVSLELGGEVIAGTNLTPSGDDLVVSFDLSCVLAGAYRISGSRTDGCPVQPLDRVLQVIKSPPPGACRWQPWAASWSSLNLGEDLDPPNAIYDPTNWDYSFSQTTILNTPQDTPDGSAYALHWFLDAQPPDPASNGTGSGGVYQQITVTPGVPLKYSFWWKGAASSNENWFEFLLIDGPFSIVDVDQSPYVGQWIIHKVEGIGGSSFPWEQLTDTSPEHRVNETITPSSSTVTVVLKAGRYPQEALEAFFDDVRVWQGAGPNLLVNGDFENGNQIWSCDNEAMAQDACQQDFWLRSSYVIVPPCPDPFADIDEDGDVDHEDFGIFQQCYTGQGNGPVDADCLCFDRPEAGSGKPDGDVDQADYQAFEACASGAMVPADATCDD